MRVFHDLEITEHTGHGIPKILETYGEEVFQITDNYINVVIPYNQEVVKNHGNINGNVNGNININLTDNEQRVINVLINDSHATLDQIAQELGLSKRTVSRLFNSLKSQNIIKRVGSSKTGYWKIIR